MSSHGELACLVFSYSRLNGPYSLSTPRVLGLYFDYFNISHFSLVSDVHMCLRLQVIGHAVSRIIW